MKSRTGFTAGGSTLQLLSKQVRNFSCELADCVFNHLLNILGRRLVSLLPGGYSQLVPYILQCFIPNRVSSARRYQCEPYMLNSSWMRTGDSCPYPHIQCSPPGSSVHGILQARILEWVAIPFSRRSSRPRDRDSSPSEPPGQRL